MNNHEIFTLSSPKTQSAPLIFNAPHSGALYHEDFLSQCALTKRDLRTQEDFRVDELFSDAVDKGCVLLKALYPRSFIDLNREPYELDPSMFDGALPSYIHHQSLYVLSGIGTIPKQLADGRHIYAHQLSWAMAQNRIDGFYTPYHNALRNALDQIHNRFGVCLLIDCHSMPQGDNPYDMVIGDVYGRSAQSALSALALSSLRNLGYKVGHNQPYAGGFITKHYGAPTHQRHALQIEINRRLYMDETRLTLTSDYQTLKNNLNHFIDDFISFDFTHLKEDLQCALKV